MSEKNIKRDTKNNEQVEGNQETRQNVKSGSRRKSKPGNRGQRRRGNSRRPDSDAYTSRENDPSWYGHSDQILKDAASLSFANVAGSRLNLHAIGDKSSENNKWDSVPGVMALSYLPTYCYEDGTGSSMNSAMNVSGKNIYSFVRHANSGSKNYEWQDLMCAIAAADQVFAAIGCGIRVYGLSRLYQQKNSYMPRALVEACGFDFDDLSANLADFRYQLNVRIAQSSVIWVPSDMSVVARHFWMNTTVFMDNASLKAQFYLYKQQAFYQYSSTASERGSSLVPVLHNPDGLLTVKDYFNLLDGLLNPLIQDEDTGIMFGDMLKAYGADRLYNLKPISEDFTIEPMYSQEVLEQITNTIILPINYNLDKLPVLTQTDGRIVMGPYVAVSNTSSHGFLEKYFLNFKGVEIPEPSSIMVATRNTAFPTELTDGPDEETSYIRFIAGSEVFVSCIIYHHGGDPVKLTHTTLRSSVVEVPATGDFSALMTQMSLFSTFDWSPMMYYYRRIGDPGASQTDIIAIEGDIDNYTFVTQYDIIKMHTTAVLSEYGVPYTV